MTQNKLAESKGHQDKERYRKQGSKLACPVCQKPVVQKYHPFCSKRCSDIDLHRWLSDHYRITTEELDIETEI